MNAERVTRHPRIVASKCLVSLTVRQAIIYDHKKDKKQPDNPRIDGRCYLRGKGEEATSFDFTVRNPQGQLFHIIAVDKCMFSDHDKTKRCDCLVFTEAVSVFIDLKENKSVAGRKSSRRDAIIQITASINWFLTEQLLTDRENVLVIVANGTRKRHPSFNSNNIAKTAELEKDFPSLRIRYDELPFYKL